MSVRAEAFFFGAGRGARFCLLHEPAKGASRGSVLQVGAFAEEQNRCRLATAHGARALAHAGFTVLQMDLLGCGDSAGDFGEATWHAWLEDLRHGASILAKRSGGPLWLWGVRAGALLASELLMQRQVGEHTQLVLWQPVLSGAQHLKQFLRLRMARETAREDRVLAAAPQPLMAGAQADGGHTVLDMVSAEHARARLRGAAHQLRADWVAGRSVEVAGYTVSPSLAFSLERAVFELPADHRARVVWLECARDPAEPLAAPTQVCLNTLAAQGQAVRLLRIPEQPFWQTTETHPATALVAATVAAMEGLQ